METDWKKFRAMTSVWRERHLADRNTRIVRMLTDPQKTETERFWDAEEQIRKEAMSLRWCFDDLRRSTMAMRLLQMRAAGMIKRDDLAEFSSELQSQIFDHVPGND